VDFFFFFFFLGFGAGLHESSGNFMKAKQLFDSQKGRVPWSSVSVGVECTVIYYIQYYVHYSYSFVRESLHQVVQFTTVGIVRGSFVTKVKTSRLR
jgi:hypothetical protein